jgi:hypothetical protein
VKKEKAEQRDSNSQLRDHTIDLKGSICAKNVTLNFCSYKTDS